MTHEEEKNKLFSYWQKEEPCSNNLQKYPYFTVTHVSAGQLVKLINNKFDTYHDALEFINERFKNKEDAFNSEQIVILEYDSPYNSNIHTIFNFGKKVLLKV